MYHGVHTKLDRRKKYLNRVWDHDYSLGVTQFTLDAVYHLRQCYSWYLPQSKTSYCSTAREITRYPELPTDNDITTECGFLSSRYHIHNDISEWNTP